MSHASSLWHVTPASSLWKQLLLPIGRLEQLISLDSVPLHPTLSKKIGPVPGPKKAWRRGIAPEVQDINNNNHYFRCLLFCYTYTMLRWYHQANKISELNPCMEANPGHTLSTMSFISVYVGHCLDFMCCPFGCLCTMIENVYTIIS